MPYDVSQRISLRTVGLQDLPQMFEFQLDPVANEMAGTRARSREAFDALWARNLVDPAVTALAILLHDQLVGSVCCFQATGITYVGYWIDRAYWGQGIASTGLQIFLQHVPIRPLRSRVATTNVASLRVLEKCGFVIIGHEHSPASDRYLECEEAVLELR